MPEDTKPNRLNEVVDKYTPFLADKTTALLAEAESLRWTASELKSKHREMIEGFKEEHDLNIPDWRMDVYIGSVYRFINVYRPQPITLKRYQERSELCVNTVRLFGEYTKEEPIPTE